MHLLGQDHDFISDIRSRYNTIKDRGCILKSHGAYSNPQLSYSLMHP